MHYLSTKIYLLSHNLSFLAKFVKELQLKHICEQSFWGWTTSSPLLRPFSWGRVSTLSSAESLKSLFSPPCLNNFFMIGIFGDFKSCLPSKKNLGIPMNLPPTLVRTYFCSLPQLKENQKKKFKENWSVF